MYCSHHNLVSVLLTAQSRQCTAHSTKQSVYCSHHKLVSVLLTAQSSQCTAHSTKQSVYCSQHKAVSVLLTAQSTETYRRPHSSIYINPVLGLQVFFWIFETWGRGTIGCPETSARNCHYSLRNNPEERSSHIPVHSFVWNRSITYCKEVYEGGIRTADITI